MTNHTHLIAMPQREDSLSVLPRRVHGRYAQYYNARHGRSGHLWQNRYFACCLGPGHLWAALAYVEMNPVRAGLAEQPGDYRWSSAGAHLGTRDPCGLIDLEWWRRESGGVDWGRTLSGPGHEQSASLRRCTYAGRPFGDEEFVKGLSEQFGRHWVRGRPRKEPVAAAAAIDTRQLALFAERTGRAEKSRSSGALSRGADCGARLQAAGRGSASRSICPLKASWVQASTGILEAPR
jgi:putative transposase